MIAPATRPRAPKRTSPLEPLLGDVNARIAAASQLQTILALVRRTALDGPKRWTVHHPTDPERFATGRTIRSAIAKLRPHQDHRALRAILGETFVPYVFDGPAPELVLHALTPLGFRHMNLSPMHLIRDQATRGDRSARRGLALDRDMRASGHRPR